MLCCPHGATLRVKILTREGGRRDLCSGLSRFESMGYKIYRFSFISS